MKVQNLLFIKYSNYSNRLIKPIGTYMTDYYTQGDDVLEVAKVSFHQGNGIYAEQIVTTDFTSFVYNYLLTSDNDDATLAVTTRWFVIGKEDLRNGQVRVSLKRDLISDYFNDVVNADFMMERGNLDFGRSGTIDNVRDPDPLIFLPEDQQYNQIKKSEHLLYRYGRAFNDDTLNEPAWIVGYIAKNIEGYQTVEIQELGDGQTYGTIWGLEFCEDYIQNNRDDAFNVIAMPLKDCVFFYSVGPKTYVQKKELSIAIMTALAAKGLLYDLQIIPYLPGMSDTIGSGLYWNQNVGNMVMSTQNVASATTGPYDHVAVMEYGIYKGQYPGNVECTHSATSIIVKYPSDWPTGGTLKSVVFVSDKGASSVSDWNFWTGNTNYSLVHNRYVFVSGTDYNINADGDIQFVNPNLKNDLFTMMDNGTAHLEIVYQYGTNPGTVQPVIVSLAKSSDEFTVDIDSTGLYVETDIDLYATKESINTSVYRIVSPNQDGIFEWSPAMNYVFKLYNSTYSRYCSWNTYKVAVSLKPFNPYIRVCPDFEYEAENGDIAYYSLYGENFGDGRGLICGGDYSLTMPSSAWENYQLNNKTYGSTFSREITTLEKQYQFGIANDVLAGVGSTFGGAVAGGLKGGIPGAIAGAAVGLGTGIYKGIENSVMRRESINKTKAEFRMNLQSIQARPDSLTKISALDPDNKIWPYVEVYSATDDEKDIFEQKMCTEGMTAHKKTTISAQMTNTTVRYTYAPEGAGVAHETYQYFSGSIIKMPTSTEATPEMINEINNELEAGIYFNVELF